MINSISISNFKSIKSSSTTLPSFGAIVGKNAAGKTNLIQAIRFVRDLAMGKKVSDAQKRISLIPGELFNFSDKTNNTFTVEMGTNENTDVSFVLSVQIGLDSVDSNTPSLSIYKESLQINKEDGSKSLVYRREKNSLTDNNETPISINVDKDTLALYVYKVPETDKVRNLLENIIIPDMEIFNSSEVLSIGSVVGDKEDLASLLISLNHKKPELYGKFQEIIRKLLPQFSSLIEIASPSSGEPEKERFLVVLEESNLKGKLSMQSVSAGDLRTLFLVATTINMNKHASLIVEEIENGIHPKRLKDLIERLETIAKINELQVIFTTHSPMVINDLSPSKVVFVIKNQEKGTQFKLLEDSDEITKIKDFLINGGDLTDYLHVQENLIG